MTPKEMTQKERQALIQDLEDSRDSLLRTVNGIDEKMWQAKQVGKWCIAEVVEHLNIIEVAIFRMAIPRFLGQPIVPQTDPGKDAEISSMVRDRSKRIEAPERVSPKGTGATPDQEISKFRGLRNETLEFVRTTTDDLRHHAGEHPVLGSLDCYQWLLALSAHTARHVLQIEELKTPALVIN